MKAGDKVVFRDPLTFSHAKGNVCFVNELGDELNPSDLTVICGEPLALWGVFDRQGNCIAADGLRSRAEEMALRFRHDETSLRKLIAYELESDGAK